jgi:hypothetical protein
MVGCQQQEASTWVKLPMKLLYIELETLLDPHSV